MSATEVASSADKSAEGPGQISDREQRQIDQANASGKTPVVFIHGLWLLPSSWDNWVEFFEENGYAGLTPDWPGDPETVAEARANPDVLAKTTLKQVADHTAEVIGALEKKPAVMGHSTGGLPGPAGRRPRALRRDGRDRPGPVPRCAAAAFLIAPRVAAGAEEPAQPRARGCPDL
jgi:pimeloyl-ACP methyl ester carboxylesterase